MGRSVVFRSNKFLLLLPSGALIAAFTVTRFTTKELDAPKATSLPGSAPAKPMEHDAYAHAQTLLHHVDLQLPTRKRPEAEPIPSPSIMRRPRSKDFQLKEQKFPPLFVENEVALPRAIENWGERESDHVSNKGSRLPSINQSEQELSVTHNFVDVVIPIMPTMISEINVQRSDMGLSIKEKQTREARPHDDSKIISHREQNSNQAITPPTKNLRGPSPISSTPKNSGNARHSDEEKKNELKIHDEQLPEWHTYPIRNFKSNYLRFLLMQLARRNAPREEIPYRKALIETLLSDKYEMRVNVDWDEETEDKEIKLLRRDFVFDYLRRVIWQNTKHERLFLGDNEDLHQVDLDAFDEAINLPLRLGIVRQEDLDCDTIIDDDTPMIPVIMPSILE